MSTHDSRKPRGSTGLLAPSLEYMPHRLHRAATGTPGSHTQCRSSCSSSARTGLRTGSRPRRRRSSRRECSPGWTERASGSWLGTRCVSTLTCPRFARVLMQKGLWDIHLGLGKAARTSSKLDMPEVLFMKKYAKGYAEFILRYELKIDILPVHKILHKIHEFLRDNT